MKELFNKLSNLFSFGKEHRLVNEEGGPAEDFGKEFEADQDVADIFDEGKKDMPAPNPKEAQKKGGQAVAAGRAQQEKWPTITVGEPTITEGGREMNLEPIDLSLRDKPEALSEYGDYEQMFKDAKALAGLIKKPGQLNIKSSPLFEEVIKNEGEEDYDIESSEWVKTELKNARLYTSDKPEELADIEDEELKDAVSAIHMHYQEIIDNSDKPKEGAITAKRLLDTFANNYNRLPDQTKREVLGYVLACQRHNLLVSRDQFVEAFVDELQKPKAGRKEAGEVLAYFSTHPEQRTVAGEEEAKQVIAVQPTRKPRQ